MSDSSTEELFFGDLNASMAIFEEIYLQVGLGRSQGQILPESARAFAQRLILDPSVDSAREHMLQDRTGATAFYEVAHDACDHPVARLPSKHTTSDGKHEPFLLLASAVLNRLAET